jgi:hypothetical protein
MREWLKRDGYKTWWETGVIRSAQVSLRRRFESCLLSTLLFSTLAAAFQSPRTHQDILPDAPLAQQPSNLPIEFFDGKSTWRQLQELPPKGTTFWSMGKWDSPAPLRTNRETLRSPWFIVPEAAGWAACSIDARVNRNSPNVPQGKELWLDACVPMMVSTPAHYLLDRFVSRPLGLIFPGYVITRHLRGAVTRVYP